MTVLGYPVVWWLAEIAAAALVGLVVVLICSDYNRMKRWAPHRAAYQHRLADRERRRPSDEAWAAWVTDDYGLRVLIDVTVGGFERRVDELWERTQQARSLVDAEVLH